MKILRNAAFVAALGLAASMTVAPAMASADQYLIARCANGGYGIEVKVRYLTTGTQHVFNQVSWRITGSVGGQNTIRFGFVQDANPDQVFKVINYTGGRTGTRNISVSRPKAHQVFVKLGARFDTSASSDPGCTSQTRGI
ncbi:hypothetical protein [Nonomuraea gerenzanensis]|uniref:Secreted protein n=1 Tax=Nonomuraea gerenzanensis TaxID=93944 RepID=A0A1M4DX84_9ACTN|nr:hypothetical protein [Nonomuraea gerenzanensis]UBU13531.1 hypothetical protein LCN96_00385 [Nonomuraea gerenzanensis]SBO91195.1 hypothetical protein BN4615_P709 [Nonomuraea gerenzanensis]